MLNPKFVKKFDQVVSKLKKTKTQVLFMQYLDFKSLHIQLYSDASFASNYDLSSQMRCIVLLTDKFQGQMFYILSHTEVIDELEAFLEANFTNSLIHLIMHI